MGVPVWFGLIHQAGWTSPQLLPLNLPDSLWSPSSPERIPRQTSGICCQKEHLTKTARLTMSATGQKVYSDLSWKRKKTHTRQTRGNRDVKSIFCIVLKHEDIFFKKQTNTSANKERWRGCSEFLSAGLLALCRPQKRSCGREELFCSSVHCLIQWLSW